MSSHVPVVYIYCDNQATIMNDIKSKFNEKKRHTRIRHNSIKQLLSQWKSDVFGPTRTAIF